MIFLKIIGYFVLWIISIFSIAIGVEIGLGFYFDEKRKGDKNEIKK